MIKPFFERLQPAPIGGAFRDDNFWIWCGSVMKGNDGLYHMFASSWSKKVPFNPNWLTHSMVVHATSPRPEGPYTYVDDVLPQRGPDYWDGMVTHNPTIHKVGDTYVLFYTGMTYRTPLGQNGEVGEQLRVEARSSQRIGFATAKSLNGPWTRSDTPCLDARPGHWDAFMTTNPAPCVLPDGQIHLIYKSTNNDQGAIQCGVARADSLDSPFERIGPDGPITFKDTNIPYEDAYVWYQDGMFQMIFNDLKGGLTGEDHSGAHALSENGIDWELASKPQAYSRNVLWEDGTRSTQGSLERPQLLIEDGIPTHLFAATADGPRGFRRASNTWNMAIPLTM